jgi:hypothetical protein
MSALELAFRFSVRVLAGMSLLASPVAWAGPVQTPAQAAALAAKAGLLGTWALVRYEDVAASGKVSKNFGEHPTGYFVYDNTGHMNIQIAADPPVSEFQSKIGTESELRAALRGYAASFGTYRLDLAKGTVTHVVEGSLMPDYRGTEQVRPFTIVGDVLTMVATRPDGSRNIRELHRLK